MTNYAEFLIAAGIFLCVVLVIEGGGAAYRALRKAEQKKVRSRLRTFSAEGFLDQSVDILKRRPLSQVPWLNDLLIKIPRAHEIDRQLEQADSKMPLGFFILLTCLLTIGGFMMSEWVSKSLQASMAVAVIFGCIPFFYVSLKKRKRMRKFERQLPDALDLLARSLRAGHAFGSGLKMAADEFDDPLGTEFGKTFEEINFGIGVPDALKNLVNRVECADLNFFAISVIIQRETGGNLAEILENIAYLIRERFKLHGKVQALSAEGRLSGIILFSLPFFIAFTIYFLNPEYISVLFTDPIGRAMLAVGVLLMVVGAFVMKKMIEIRV